MPFTQIPAIKPPLGIIPRAAHNRARTRTIIEAMQRYSTQRKKIPEEWFKELTEYINMVE